MAGGKALAAPDRNWQAEDDHRTMMRAAEIQGDAGRMAGVRAHQKKQFRALGRMHKLIGGGSKSPSKGGRR